MNEYKVMRNRMGVVFNSYQGNHLRVLTVCSAGCLRSPTAAHILSSDPFNFNTRCAGTSKEYAIVHADPGLVLWADEIVVMDEDQAKFINEIQHGLVANYEDSYAVQYKKVHVLDIEDNYAYRDPELVEIMTEKFFQIFKDRLKVDVV